MKKMHSLFFLFLMSLFQDYSVRANDALDELLTDIIGKTQSERLLNPLKYRYQFDLSHQDKETYLKRAASYSCLETMSQEHNIPYYLVVAIAATESSIRLNAKAVTTTASGMFQITKPTYIFIQKQLAGKSVIPPFSHLLVSAELGCESAGHYLSYLFRETNSDQARRFEIASWRDPVMAYYAGKKRVGYSLHKVVRNNGKIYTIDPFRYWLKVFYLASDLAQIKMS